MKKTFLQAIRVGEQGLPDDVIDAIWGEYEKDQQGFQQQLAQVRFESVLNEAISRAGGRNVKAITALLDVDALQKSGDQKGAVDKALARLKKESDYLFAQTPPPYAPGTGTVQLQEETPTTLAGALRERLGRG